jgi:acetolactate decarboxylase
VNKAVLVILAGSLALSVGPVSTTTATAGGGHEGRGPSTSRKAETLYQFGRFDTFRGTYPGQTTGGLYDGFATIGRVLAKGDTGLGASDKVDGESIVIDGRVYRLGADNGVPDVTLSRRSDTTPFMAVTTFDTDARATFTGIESLGAKNTDGTFRSSSLMGKIEQLIATHPKLAPAGDPDPDTTWSPTYVFRISGRLDTVQSRTFTTPDRNPDGTYPTLPTVVANQTVFTNHDVWADLVVVWCPPEMGAAGVNVAGTHVHWISKDRRLGGHVLDLQAGALRVRVDKTPYFRLVENPAAPTAR